MNIRETIHNYCESYFNFEIRDLKNPVTKVALFVLKALTMATLVIPVGIYLIGRITKLEKRTDAEVAKITTVATPTLAKDTVPQAIAPQHNKPSSPTVGETEIEYLNITSEPKFLYNYAWAVNSTGYKEAIKSYYKKGNSSWNPFSSIVKEPALIYLLPENENYSLLRCLESAFDENPHELLPWIKLNQTFFKDKFKDQEIPFTVDFNNGKALSKAKHEILKGIPITELKIFGEFDHVDNGWEELGNLRSTLTKMRSLKKIDAQYARDISSFDSGFDSTQHLYGFNGFLNGLNIDELSIYVSIDDLKNFNKIPATIKKLTIRAEKVNSGFKFQNDQIRKNLENITSLEEITLADMPSSCGGFLTNLPKNCKVLKIETCRNFKISTDALIKAFQGSPLNVLYLKNYEGYSESQYNKNEIEKLKKAQIAKKIVVESY